jgi:hypothetical protein
MDMGMKTMYSEYNVNPPPSPDRGQELSPRRAAGGGAQIKIDQG